MQSDFHSQNFIYLLLFFISSCLIHNTNSDIETEGLNEIKFLENLTESFSLKVKAHFFTNGNDSEFI